MRALRYLLGERYPRHVLHATGLSWEGRSCFASHPKWLWERREIVVWSEYAVGIDKINLRYVALAH